VANVCHYLESSSHQTCLNNLFLVASWNPEAALCQKTDELLQVLGLWPVTTVYLVTDVPM